MAYESTANSIISDWGDGTGAPQKARRVQTEIARFNHRLRETGLFEDEALIRLLDSHPLEDLTVCTMRPNPPADERWIAGEATGLNGAELLDAVKRGALWISPRHVMTANAAYGDVFRRLMSEYTKATGVAITSADGAMILSSPKMGVFYHVDLVETMLWHIRGHKTILVYPSTDAFRSEAALESILLKENLTDLPYRADMDASATPVHLAPGEAVAWPVHAPHRVLNGDDLNVSISIEYSTPRSLLLNGVYYLNGRLRRMTGMNLTSRAMPDVLRPVCLLASKALKILKPLKATAEATHARQFDIDPSAPGCIRWRGEAPVWAAEL